MVLIFPGREQGAGNGCDLVNSYQELKACLKNSKYKVDLDPYLHPLGYGIIQPHDLSWINHRLNEGFQQNIELPHDLIGKNYVVFNESSLEFKDKSGLLRSGPMSQSKVGSEDDRAMRGMLLFHMFVDNFDAKDANGESLLISTGDHASFLQAPVDLGGAFRGFPFRGRGINHYKTKSFLRKSLTNSSRLVYTHPMLYRSRASDKATFSDLLWMAEKIIALSESTIRDAVRHTNTPAFYQEVLTYRILMRQRRIAHLFNLSSRINSPEPVKPDIYLDLSGDKYLQVARELHIPESVFVREMLAAGIQPGDSFRDRVVKKGKVRKCHKSLVVNILEKYAYPTGLSRSPSKKHEKPGRCSFHVKS